MATLDTGDTRCHNWYLEHEGCCEIKSRKCRDITVFDKPLSLSYVSEAAATSIVASASAAYYAGSTPQLLCQDWSYLFAGDDVSSTVFIRQRGHP